MYELVLVRLGRNWLKGMELLDSLLAVRLANMSSFRTSGLLPGASTSESLPRPGNQRVMKHKRQESEGEKVVQKLFLKWKNTIEDTTEHIQGMFMKWDAIY